MQDKRILFENEDGCMALLIPVATCGLTLQEIAAKDVPSGCTPIIVDEADLPHKDRDFFGAWELEGQSVRVNIDKAREITKQRLRMERKPLLQAQDVAFQRALEEGKPTNAIVAEKQRLRDLPRLADEAGTLTELRALKP